MALNSTVTAGENFFQNTVNNIQLFSVDWLLGLVITIVILLLITRNVSKWSEWAFPISVMLLVAGLRISIIQIVGTAIMFAVAVMNRNSLGDFIDSLPVMSSLKKSIDYKTSQKRASKTRKWSLEKQGVATKSYDDANFLSAMLGIEKQAALYEKNKKKK